VLLLSVLKLDERRVQSDLGERKQEVEHGGGDGQEAEIAGGEQRREDEEAHDRESLVGDELHSFPRER
jgi:hypothetical protein